MHVPVAAAFDDDFARPPSDITTAQNDFDAAVNGANSDMQPSTDQPTNQGYISGCFPGHALATLRDGRRVRMDQLQTGDEVGVPASTGQGLSFEPIYTWGHRAAGADATLLRIQLEPRVGVCSNESSSHKVLQLTPNHFVLLAAPAVGSIGTQTKRAADVRVGDAMWALDESGGWEAWTVTDTHAVVAKVRHLRSLPAITSITEYPLSAPHPDPGLLWLHRGRGCTTPTR